LEPVSTQQQKVVRVARDRTGMGPVSKKGDAYVFVVFQIMGQDVSMRLPIYDSETNRNWMAELDGTLDEIIRACSNSVSLMNESGFAPGWRATAEYAGAMNYIVFVREAVERVWRKRMI
jgi:hypothetical protein